MLSQLHKGITAYCMVIYVWSNCISNTGQIGYYNVYIHITLDCYYIWWVLIYKHLHKKFAI